MVPLRCLYILQGHDFISTLRLRITNEYVLFSFGRKYEHRDFCQFICFVYTRCDVLPYCYNMTSNNGLNVLNATCVH